MCKSETGDSAECEIPAELFDWRTCDYKHRQLDEMMNLIHKIIKFVQICPSYSFSTSAGFGPVPELAPVLSDSTNRVTHTNSQRGKQ